jgi:hypothetical protein
MYFDDDKVHELRALLARLAAPSTEMLALAESNQRLLASVPDTTVMLSRIDLARSVDVLSALDNVAMTDVGRAVAESHKALSIPPTAMDGLQRSIEADANLTRSLERATRPIEFPPTTIDLVNKAIADVSQQYSNPFADRIAESLTALATGQQAFAAQMSALGDVGGLSERTMRLLDAAALQSVARDRAFPADLLERALEPQLDFYRFAESHLSRAMAGDERKRRNHVQAVESAAAIVTPATEAVTVSASLGPTPPSPPPSSQAPRGKNLFVDLQDELSLLDFDADIDVAKLITDSAVSAVALLGAGLVRMVSTLNLQAERKGGAPIFKPSTALMESTSKLALRVARSETSFYEVVDDLFFVFYEGSGAGGKDNRLVALANEDPTIGDAGLLPLWDVKQLRLGARHDPGHGTPQEIAAKHVKIGAAYKRLIGVEVPCSQEHWKKAQVTLFRKLFEMLERIVNRRRPAAS